MNFDYSYLLWLKYLKIHNLEQPSFEIKKEPWHIPLEPAEIKTFVVQFENNIPVDNLKHV